SGLGWSLTDLAIAWTLRRPELTSAIVGARSPQQIQQTYTAGNRVLAVDAAEAVETAIRERADQMETVGGAAKPRV
ncbi:MAG: aldo/keto reductase, partial [Planctomycetaceae bacterium]